MKHTTHAEAAEQFIKDRPRTSWHDDTLWFVREKRDRAARSVPEWEILRDWASQIKEHTLSDLDNYLRQFEARAQENGITIHWAADGNEHNEIIYGIINQNNSRRIVKSKSMLTEECLMAVAAVINLNAYCTTDFV